VYECAARKWGHDPLTTLKSVQNHLADLTVLGFLDRDILLAVNGEASRPAGGIFAGLRWLNHPAVESTECTATNTRQLIRNQIPSVVFQVVLRPQDMLCKRVKR